MFWAYVKASRENLKQQNFMMWIQGIYIKNAIESVLCEDGKYPERPIEIFDSEKEQEKKEEEKAKANRELINAQILQVQSYFKKQSQDK